MAYTPRNSGSSQVQNKSAVSAAPATGKVEALLSTGLFAPEEGKSKAIGTVRVKESITIPAGSYINLYENDRRSKDTDPVFKLQVRAGKTASK